MSIKPNERIEFFLAKIAGEDIDTNTLTPPGAINATERALDGISERLNDIGSAPSDNLPEYTAADAGKALTVNGSGAGVEWAAGGVYQITATETDLGNDTFVTRLDKTFLEIYTAMQNKMFCVISFVIANPVPTDYYAQSDLVREIHYDQGIGALVICGSITFTCSTINDYPEYVDS